MSLLLLLYGGAGQVEAAPVGGGIGAERRYTVKVGGRLMLFARQQDALNAVNAEHKKRFPAKKAIPQALPERDIALTAVARLIEKATYDAAIKQKRYGDLLDAYESAMQDEEDIEVLLMAA